VVLLREARQQSDAVLIEVCQNGDSTGFDELVRRYKDRIYNVLYRFLGNREDARDLAQETFVRAYRGIGSFKGEAKVYTWLYSIAANLARNRLRDCARKGRNRGTSLEALEDAAPGYAEVAASTDRTPRTFAAAHEMDEALQRCLDELPEHYRLVFVLRTFDDLSYDEIAEAAGCPRGTVKSRLNKARLLLRERLEALDVL